MSENVNQISAYPVTRIMNIISLSLSGVLLLVGIQILTQEDAFKNELYFYWFIGIYVIAEMLVKMFTVVKSDLPNKKVIIAFLMEFLYFLPVVLNDWNTEKESFALVMLLTNIIRAIYYSMGSMKSSVLI